AEPASPILAGDGATPARKGDVTRYLPSYECKPNTTPDALQQMQISQVRICLYLIDSEEN
ncbi:MAG: hypothetical protein ACLQOO_20775, partial [Terriglobia bacterium]